MGLFDGLFGKDKEKEKEHAGTGTMTIECPHGSLLPRWDSIDDIGHEERAVSFVCEACGEAFTPHDAWKLRESAADRLPIETPES
jgi:hypothetical protein